MPIRGKDGKGMPFPYDTHINDDRFHPVPIRESGPI